MFDDTRRLRELRRKIRSLREQRATLILVAAVESARDQRSELVRDITDRTEMLEILESSLIIEQAQRLGIDIPSPAEKPNLWVREINDKTLGEMEEWGVTCCLSSVGKAVTRRRIREERRKDIEWRVKIIVTILTALTGIGGIIVGILALLK